jgi:hypothetical protein|tara:strand:+ start:1195 stop:1929 length:735 start_codon:yes stop_codon:yes gene_type:complete
MATTTFSGAVRSENGFKVVSKNATTGAFTEQINSTSSGVLEIQKVATSGRDNIVAAGTTVGANNASLGTAATIFNITPNAHGSGIADAAINTFVTKIGGDITTTILIDLHGGLASGGTADDVIGTDGGAANAYIAELTSAVNGIPYLIEFACLEVPTGGDPDINLVCSATATDAENAAVTSGTVLLNNGDLTLGFYAEADAGATLAALSKKYLYLTSGDATEAAYTAGKLVIKIHGAAFDYANG